MRGVLHNFFDQKIRAMFLFTDRRSVYFSDLGVKCIEYKNAHTKVAMYLSLYKYILLPFLSPPVFRSLYNLLIL